MIAYIVTVRPASSNRYTDSVWAEQSHAIERAHGLRAEFQRRGWSTKQADDSTFVGADSDKWGAWVTEIVIQDACLAPNTKRKQ